MRVIFCGTPDLAAEALRAVCRAGHDVVLAVTMPDRPKGRKGTPAPSEVKQAAAELGIPVYQPASLKTEEAAETLAAYRPDLMVVTAYGRIIPERILDLPKYGCINEHASLLPAYRGAAPIQWAILDGCETTGVTIMQMGPGLDTGDILSKREVTIAPEETTGSLFDRLSACGAELLVETMAQIEAGKAVRTPQPAESTTPYARMITKSDGRIDWNRSARELERLVRGMDPWPSAYTALGGRMLKIWKTAVREEEMPGTGARPAGPGTILSADKNGIAVQTGSGVLLLREIQLEGKKRMDHETFLRGSRIPAGTRLGE